MSTSIRTMILAACMLCLIATSVQAGPQARLKGTVKDNAGNAITEAVITITCPDSATYKKVLKPGKKGDFKALILDATKSYAFHVEAPGYVKHEEAFKISVGTTDNQFDFVLKTQEEMAAVHQQELKEQPGYKQLDEGRTLFAEGRIDEAVAKYEEAVKLVPDLLPAWAALVEVANQGDDYQRQLELAEKCLEIDDEANGCLVVAANASTELGLEEKSAQYMALYQELNPDDPTTLYNTAVEYLNKLDDENARPLLEECLQVSPDYPNCLFQYGMVLLRSGDMEGAKKHLQRYLEVDPEGGDAATAADVVKYL